MGVTQYGYWQLYILYSSYISFLHFGLADGYYLRNSGTLYQDLDRNKFSFMFWFLLIMEIVLAALLAGGYTLLSHQSQNLNENLRNIQSLSQNLDQNLIQEVDPLNGFVFRMTCVAAVLIIPRVFIQFAWQAGDRFKHNALIIVVERAFFLLSVAFYIFRQYTRVEQLIYLDLIGKFLALLLALFWAKDMLFAKPVSWREGLSELRENATAGISLMLASITSSLIIGLIQLSIKNQWGIDTYSRIALTFSLSNLLMIFINALALVLLPHIRRQQSADNLRLYDGMRRLLMLLLFLLLNVYYPFRLFVNYWLPKYAEGIVYMAILFPICIYEAKTQLLTNTFLKAYRKEREILKANLISLALCVLLMLGFAFLLKNLFLTTLSILIVLAFRSALCEYYLAHETGQDFRRDSLIELAITVIFVISQWVIGGLPGALIYLLISLVYTFMHRAALQEALAKGKTRVRGG